MSAPAFLEPADVSAGYGAITVLYGLSLRLAPLETLAGLGATAPGHAPVLTPRCGGGRELRSPGTPGPRGQSEGICWRRTTARASAPCR